MAVPALGALAADPLYSLVDTAFVGHLGIAQLGALAVGTAAFTASFWIFSFLAYGLTPRVANALGRGDPSAATRFGVQSLFLAVAFGAATTLFGVLLAGPIVRVFGASDAVAVYAEPFLAIRAFAAIPVLIGHVGQGWLRGMQDTRTAMIIVLSGLVVNVALNYVLIYPGGLGVRGSALATVIGQSGAAAAFVVVLARRMERPRWRFDLGAAKELLGVGLDLTVRTGALLAAMTLATAVAARMGEVELASWQIAMQVFLLLALTLDSIAIAGQALVGRLLGAGEPGRAFEVGSRLLGMGIVLGLALLVVVGAGSFSLAQIFTNDARVIAAAGWLLLWVALVQPLSAVAFTFDGILIGASDTRFLAVAMVGASIVYALGSLLSLRWGAGAGGLAAATTIWLALRAASTGIRFSRRRWAV